MDFRNFAYIPKRSGKAKDRKQGEKSTKFKKRKPCVLCKKMFVYGSNWELYCDECKAKM